MNDKGHYHSYRMGAVPSPDPPAIHCSATAISGEHSGTTRLPPLLAPDPDPAADRRVIEFFTAHIRNPHTRNAYAQATGGIKAATMPSPSTVTKNIAASVVR